MVPEGKMQEMGLSDVEVVGIVIGPAQNKGKPPLMARNEQTVF